MSKYIIPRRNRAHPPIIKVSPIYRNAIQYKKLLSIWSYIIDRPDILEDAPYDENVVPDLFEECRSVLFSSNSSSLSKTQMKELNKIWRILNK